MVTALALSGSLPAAAQDLKEATLRLPYTYNGHRSPYLLGVEKGFYAEEGIDLTVLEGKGVSTSMQLLAAGQDTFAVAEPPALMLAVEKGMPLTQVVQLYQTNPTAIVTWTDLDISGPEGLVGKTVAVIQGDASTTMFYAMLNKNGIDRNAVKVVASDGGTRIQNFLSKRTEAVTAFANDSVIGLQALTDGKTSDFLYADFGIDTMGEGIAVNNETLESDPELVRGFVKATLRSYAYALEHPEESIDVLAQYSPKIDKAVEVEKLKATAALMTGPATEEHGIGWLDEAKLADAEALMLEYGGLKTKFDDLSVLYTNEFVPD
ncbi:ABC transporter substrate-binding protein [Acuticoccus mangrovi]|nr:ABC transporter substrate-binding protein [Acuticoccus mangrovi]